MKKIQYTVKTRRGLMTAAMLGERQLQLHGCEMTREDREDLLQATRWVRQEAHKYNEHQGKSLEHTTP